MLTGRGGELSVILMDLVQKNATGVNQCKLSGPIYVNNQKISSQPSVGSRAPYQIKRYKGQWYICAIVLQWVSTPIQPPAWESALVDG